MNSRPCKSLFGPWLVVIPIVPETKKPPILVSSKLEGQLSEIEEWITKGWYLAVVTGDISECWWLTMTGLHGLNEWGFTSPMIAKSQNSESIITTSTIEKSIATQMVIYTLI